MIIGKFGKEGDCYRGRIFSRERCGRVVAIRRMSIKQGDGPDFVVTTETQDSVQFEEIGAAWKRTNSKGKPYLLGPVRKLSNRLLIELDMGLQPSFHTIYCGGDRYRTHPREVFGGGALS
jgi:uncharacterized protein (DUF736 family)